MQPAARTWRRWRLPVICLLLMAAALTLPSLWRWADFDPAPQASLSISAALVLPLSALLLLVWFFVLSGLGKGIKIAGGVLLATLAGTALATVRTFDVDGNLRPILHFRWEPAPEDELDRYREQEEASQPAKLSPIDLTVHKLTDFPRYRGVLGDGVVLPLEPFSFDWSSTSPKELWRQPCGGGYSGFAVAGNVAITAEQRRDEEAIVCYDRATGRQRWVYSYPEHFRDITGDGPRATPTIHKGRVYNFGATGELVCLDGATGDKLWQRNAVKDSKAKVVTWGMTSSPLIVEDLGLVIVNPGIDPGNNAGKALAAYHLKDGTIAWAKGEHAAGYSSPQLVKLAGRPQVLNFDAAGLVGIDPSSGNELWRYRWKTYQDMNIIQPVVLGGDRVFVASEGSNGCALLQVKRKGDDLHATVVWANRSLASKFSNPIAVGAAIYGLSLGTMVCLDLETGERRWRGRYYGHGQILSIGGALLVMSERGYVALVKADPRGFRELAQMDVFADKTWNTPAIAGHQLFVRNAREMACFELPLRD
jgi:outer membrane protein assembly factor BamB